MIDLAVIGQDPGFRGGVATQTQPFLDAAVAAGREPTLLCLSYNALEGGRPDLGIPVVPVASVLPGLDGLNQLVAARRLGPIAREATAVWVVSTLASHGHAAVRARRPYGAWIGTSLASEWAGRRPGLRASRRLALRVSAPLLARLERETLRGATALYAISPASARSIAAAAGLGEHEVRILPIPVDLEAFAPLPDDDWRDRLATPTIAFVGRADDSRKNVGLLLEAFVRVRIRWPGARLRLIGSPPRGRLPDGVEATGPVPAVGPALSDAALMVLPSWQEGFGAVVAEALACGVPVVTTPCGGPEELARASGGGVVLGGFGAEEMAAAVTGLLDEPDRLAAMRRAGRVHVEREHAPERFRSLLAEAFALVKAAG